MPCRIRLLSVILLLATRAPAGPLNPPLGAPSPTNKTLLQTEPRVALAGPGPVVIDEPGSYYLTENITTALGGVTINAANVSLDLNGFALFGDGVGGNADHGVWITNTITPGTVTIRNGYIDGFSGDGVHSSPTNAHVIIERVYVRNCSDGFDLATTASIRDCRAQSCTRIGFCSFKASDLERCVAESNGVGGIQVLNGQIRGCTAIDNAGSGIIAGAGVIIDRCAANSNSQNGISTNINAIVIACSAHSNGLRGMQLQAGSIASHCTASSNVFGGYSSLGAVEFRGCAARLNDRNGFSVTEGSTIIGCLAARNGEDGFSLGSDSSITRSTAYDNGLGGLGAGIVGGLGCTIDSNTASQNPVGITATNGALVIRNSATNNATNYNLSGAQAGPISANPATETSPWANFSY